MSPSEHSRTVEIDASVEQVWSVLADLNRIAQWAPGVKTTTVTSPQADGLNSTRVCTLAPMGTISEEVTAWETNERLVVDIVEFKGMPTMRTSTVEFALAPISATRSQVTISLGYTVGMGAIGSAMDKMMLRSQVTSGLEGMAAGLKKHIETGERIHSKTPVPVEAVSVSDR